MPYAKSTFRRRWLTSHKPRAKATFPERMRNHSHGLVTRSGSQVARLRRLPGMTKEVEDCRSTVRSTANGAQLCLELMGILTVELRDRRFREDTAIFLLLTYFVIPAKQFVDLRELESRAKSMVGRYALFDGRFKTSPLGEMAE